MNNFQQMLNKARAAQKKLDEFKTKEFEFNDNQEEIIKIKITGDYEITKLDIDFVKLSNKYENDQETISAMIQIAINKAIKFVKKEEAKIISV